jgi:hypothetical protein
MARPSPLFDAAHRPRPRCSVTPDNSGRIASPAPHPSPLFGHAGQFRPDRLAGGHRRPFPGKAFGHTERNGVLLFEIAVNGLKRPVTPNSPAPAASRNTCE